MQEFALVMSCVSTGLAGLFGYLQSRDKLRYDAEIVQLKADVGACHEERDGLRSRVARLESDLAEHVGTCDAHKEKS